MLTKHTAYKYETPYMGPFLITQCYQWHGKITVWSEKKLGIIYAGLIHINWILNLKMILQKYV